jgi:hypothetical protein
VQTQTKQPEQKQEITDYKKAYEDLVAKINALPEAFTYWLTKIGSLCRVVRRDYKDFVGEFLGFQAETVSLDIGVYEETKNYLTNTIRKETKIVRIPVSGIANIEWILNVEETEVQPTKQ